MTRTEWFELVGGMAFVQEHGGRSVERKVYGGTQLLLTQEDEAAHLTVDPNDVLSESTATSIVSDNALEFVFRPNDEHEFLANFDENSSRLVSGLAGPTRPLLLTVVDANDVGKTTRDRV